jgi:hypothetical protein
LVICADFCDILAPPVCFSDNKETFIANVDDVKVRCERKSTGWTVR